MEENLGLESYDTGSGHNFVANGDVPLGKLLKHIRECLLCPTLSPVSLGLPFDFFKSWETYWYFTVVLGVPQYLAA